MMTKPLRLLEMISSFDIEGGGGGLTRFAVTLSRNLDSERFQPVVCALWDRGSELERRLIQELNTSGFEAFCCAAWDERHPYNAFLRAYKGIREYLKRSPMDILHSHSEFSDMAVVFLRLEGKAPILVRTLHNELQAIWRRRPLRRILFSQILEPLLMDDELGVSQYITQNLDGRWLAKRLGRKASYVPNALDIHRFGERSSKRHEVRSALGIPENAFLVGSVGRLSQQKGYDLLVDAAVKVLNTDLVTRFVIVGDGIEAQALKQRAEALGVVDKVIFSGQRNDIEAVLAAMDLFVCSSRWEGLSTVLMEAMAAGVPIVATDIPGNRELLRDGENAWLVAAENAEALAAGITTALKKPEIGRTFARQAQRDVQAFSIETVAARHGQLYQDLYARKIAARKAHKTDDR
jgi:glycosyltransferase involved in cell wall biosynthesis